jgi:hypothetical protein
MRNYLIILILLSITGTAYPQSNVKLYGYEIKFQSGAAPVEAEAVNGEKDNPPTTRNDAQYLIYITLPRKDKIFIRSLNLKNKQYHFTVEKINQFPVSLWLSKKQQKELVPALDVPQKGWKIIVRKLNSREDKNTGNELSLSVYLNGKVQTLFLNKLESIETYGM